MQGILIIKRHVSTSGAQKVYIGIKIKQET